MLKHASLSFLRKTRLSTIGVSLVVVSQKLKQKYMVFFRIVNIKIKVKNNIKKAKHKKNKQEFDPGSE